MSDENNAPQPPKPPAPQPPTAKTSSVPLKKETVRITLKSQGGEEGGDAPAETPAPPAAAPAKPAPPAGSKTIPLSPAPAAPGAAPVGKRTVQLKSGGPATQPLPKATVQLKSTQPVSSAPPTAAVGAGAKFQTASFEDEEDEPAGMTAVAVAALVLSFVLLVILMMGGDKVEFFVAKKGEPASGMTVPADDNPFDASRTPFTQRLPEIPTRVND